MPNERLELRAADLDYDNGIRFALIARDAEGVRVGYGGPMAIVRTDDMRPVEPFTTLDRNAARKLMDELWHIGIRPTEFKSTDAAAAASFAHLADMRAIAFAKLEIPKP
jgi:hypothetical protein